jgi:outer membrane lipopolysaccharide assembly protein LptE/RlpB
MTIANEVISKPLYRVLRKMTHENRVDVALTIAVKDWIRLRLREVESERVGFEAKYDMTFEQFRVKFAGEGIPDQYSYEVERDYFDWEAAVTNEASLREMSEQLL